MVQTDVVYKVSADTKKSCAAYVVTANDVAATLAGTAAIASRKNPAVGAVIGVHSALAWLVGNAFQRVANDPPRKDFENLVVPLRPQLPGRILSNSMTITEITIIDAAEDSASLQAQTTQAVDNLVVTIERVQGAEAHYFETHKLSDFEKVNNQRHSARAHVYVVVELLRAQELPRSVLRRGVPKFIESPGPISAREKAARLVELHDSVLERTKRMTRNLAVDSISVPSRTKIGYTTPYSLRNWERAMGAPHQKKLDDLIGGLYSIAGALAPWPRSRHDQWWADNS